MILSITNDPIYVVGQIHTTNEVGPIFDLTCDLEQEGNSPSVTSARGRWSDRRQARGENSAPGHSAQSAAAGDLDSNNQTRVYSALCGLAANKTVLQPKNSLKTNILFQFYSETDWLKSGGRPDAKGPKFISVALEKYFHGRDGIVCVFVPALSVCLIVLAAVRQWLSRLVTNYRWFLGQGLEEGEYPGC